MISIQFNCNQKQGMHCSRFSGRTACQTQFCKSILGARHSAWYYATCEMPNGRLLLWTCKQRSGRTACQTQFCNSILGAKHSAWCFANCGMPDFFFEHANKEVEGQLVRPNFANLFGVPNIVLGVLQLVKCQTSSLNMLTKKWKDSLSHQILQIYFRSDWLGARCSAWCFTTCEMYDFFFKHANKEVEGQFAVTVYYIVSHWQLSLSVSNSAWCFTTCEMSDFFFKHANKEVEGQFAVAVYYVVSHS